MQDQTVMHPKKITPEQGKDTGLALTLILLLTALATRQLAPILPAIMVLVLTMTAPRAFTPLARLWFGLSHWLGIIVTTILLSIVFLLLVTPLGLFRRLSGKDAMGLGQWKKGRESVFVQRDRRVTAADLEKPF